MQYIISGKNIDVTDGLKAAVQEKIGKLEAGNLIGTAVEGVDVYRENKEVCDTALRYGGTCYIKCGERETED